MLATRGVHVPTGNFPRARCDKYHRDGDRTLSHPVEIPNASVGVFTPEAGSGTVLPPTPREGLHRRAGPGPETPPQIALRAFSIRGPHGP